MAPKFCCIGLSFCPSKQSCQILCKPFPLYSTTMGLVYCPIGSADQQESVTAEPMVSRFSTDKYVSGELGSVGRGTSLVMTGLGWAELPAAATPKQSQGDSEDKCVASSSPIPFSKLLRLSAVHQASKRRGASSIYSSFGPPNGLCLGFRTLDAHTAGRVAAAAGLRLFASSNHQQPVISQQRPQMPFLPAASQSTPVYALIIHSCFGVLHSLDAINVAVGSKLKRQTEAILLPAFSPCLI